mgnify:CR=1 FL=1
MLTATNIFVQYGERILLNNVNLVITERDKIGLVGRNGAGKSTLLKIIIPTNIDIMIAFLLMFFIL